MPRKEKLRTKTLPDLDDVLERESSKESRKTLANANEFELDKNAVYQSNVKASTKRKEHEHLKDHKAAKEHHHEQKSQHEHHANKKHMKPSISHGHDKEHSPAEHTSDESLDKHHPSKGKHRRPSISHENHSKSSSISTDPIASRKSTVSFNPVPSITQLSAVQSLLSIDQADPHGTNVDSLFKELDNAPHPLDQPLPAQVDPTAHIDAIFNDTAQDPSSVFLPGPVPVQPPIPKHPGGHSLDAGHHRPSHLAAHHPPGHPDAALHALGHPTGHPAAAHHVVGHPPGHPDAAHHVLGHPLAAAHHAAGQHPAHHHPGANHHAPGHGSHSNRQSSQISSSEEELGGQVGKKKSVLITAHEGFHIILLKKFGLLLIIFLIMLLDGIAIFTWTFIQHAFGAPPTYYSEESYSNTLMALVSLFLVCLFSVVIVRAKIHHAALGYFLMFTFGVTLYSALKGASRAHISIKYDDIATIEKYIFTNQSQRSGGSLPEFFHRIQTNFECCGTTLIDKMEDWPIRLATMDMPKSCCKEVSTHCGEKLARTHKYDGKNKGAYRTPSGFFLALTSDEMRNIISKEKPIKIIQAPGNDGMQIMLKTLGEFYFKKLKQAYPPGTPLESMRRLQNDIITPATIAEGTLPASLGCRDETTSEKLAAIGWEIQLIIDKETSKVHLESEQMTYDWMAWKIPICKETTGIPPYDLASNLNRSGDSAKDIKHMWYISRGITENYVLKDLVWEMYCENEENQKFIPFTPALGRKWEHPAVGRFYIAFVNQLMFICFCYSIAVIVGLVIVFIIFWTYYSKMKLEEFANLPYPPEFDVLEVRQDELYIKHDKHEYDKSAAYDKPKKSQVGPGPEMKRATKGDLTQGSDLMMGSTTFKTKQATAIANKPQPPETTPPPQSDIDNLFESTIIQDGIPANIPLDQPMRRFSDDPFAPTTPVTQLNSLLAQPNPFVDSLANQALFNPAFPVPSPNDTAPAAPKKPVGGDAHDHHKPIRGHDHHKSIGGHDHHKSIGGIDHHKSIGGDAHDSHDHDRHKSIGADSHAHHKSIGGDAHGHHKPGGGDDHHKHK